MHYGKIAGFSGEFSFLNNGYPCQLRYNGLVFQTLDAAFHAQRCANPFDRMFFTDVDGVKAKSLVRKLGERSDWAQVQDQVMLDLLRIKFAPGSFLASKLVATYPRELVAVDTKLDQYWGYTPNRGQNKLGLLLEQVRRERGAGAVLPQRVALYEPVE